MEREPCNRVERECWEALAEKGWEVTRRGWPDFFCCNASGDLIVVEVKPKRGRRLKFAQRRTLQMLAARGIPCYVWTPDGGFERVTNGPLPPP
jgi:Holliday junction resolvase